MVISVAGVFGFVEWITRHIMHVGLPGIGLVEPAVIIVAVALYGIAMILHLRRTLFPSDTDQKTKTEIARLQMENRNLKRENEELRQANEKGQPTGTTVTDVSAKSTQFLGGRNT
jgi:uncharacterized membrane protein YhiD involved in acid resistance